MTWNSSGCLNHVETQEASLSFIWINKRVSLQQAGGWVKLMGHRGDQMHRQTLSEEEKKAERKEQRQHSAAKLFIIEKARLTVCIIYF